MIAMRQGERTLTWQQLEIMSDRVAASLQHAGVQPALVIAICGTNSLEYAAVFIAMIVDSDARCLFVGEGAPAFETGIQRVTLSGKGPGTPLRNWLVPEGTVPDAVNVRRNWAFNIIYSSGTTGAPKGIVQSHGMRWVHVTRAIKYSYGPDSVAVVASSLWSNTTLVGFFPALAMGGTIVFYEGRFDAFAYLKIAERVRATRAVLVPVQYQRLMTNPEFDRFDLSSFRMKFCTSAPFSAAAEVLRRWPGSLVENYGMTEGGGNCVLEARTVPHKLRTVGKPADGHDVRLIDEDGREVARGEPGEVVGRSPAMMIGYQNQPVKTREAEWHDAEDNRYIRTGDVGRFDEDGFLVLLDRRKDLIISGGFNIYPSDIEAVLCGHPNVADVVVIGVLSDTWGESPVAFIVPFADAPPAHVLREWANDRLGQGAAPC